MNPLHSSSISNAAADIQRGVGRVLFGDQYGVLVFLCSLSLFGLTWQADIFITDTYALANGLYHISEGRLFLTEAAYGPHLETPGVEQTGGGLIARNYGAIVLSVPIWFLLELVTTVADLRIALVGLWSLVLLALAVQAGRLRDDTRIVVAGAGIVLAMFALNIAFAHPLDTAETHLYSLQLFHMLVAAFTPVLLYRLIRQFETRRLALQTAGLMLLGTPLALWASVPKRHVLTSTVVLGVMYALYRSRTEPGSSSMSSPVAFRAAAYGLVALYAWVQAPEALLLLVILAAVDIPTAADNSVRSLALVGAVFLVSLTPFLLTNHVLIGSPLEPPRLLAVQGTARTEAVTAGTSAGGGSTGGASTGSTSGASGSGSALGSLLEPLRSATAPLALLWGELAAGLSVVYTQPELVYHTFVRSGSATAALNNAGTESVNLSLFESAPVLVALLAAPVTMWRTFRLRESSLHLPRTVVDVFAVVLAVALTLQYATRLPIHAQLTVRYLFPLYPIGVYLLVRLPVVRQTLSEHLRLFAWTVGLVLCLGTQLVVLVVYWTVSGTGGAFQFHGVLSLSVAAGLAFWAFTGRSDGRFGQVGAILLGGTTGLAALFVFMVVVAYYTVNNSHVIPVVQVIAELLELY